MRILTVQPLRFVKLLVFLSCLIGSVQAEEHAYAAWLENQKVHVAGLGRTNQHVTLDGESPVPLGSLWKLFVYIYLSDTKVSETPYVCSADPSLQKEEQYCCQAGGSIGREEALARSCSLYFDPLRLKIDPNDWKEYWQNKTPVPWIYDLQALNPATEVALQELLATLQAIPPSARTLARDALLEISIDGFGRHARKDLGTGIRYKTYSWHDRRHNAFGGAAGWLADGTPFWFGAPGTSTQALTTYSKALAAALPKRNLLHTNTDDTCVDVDFFGQYPLKSIRQNGKKIESGHLSGTYKLEFFNGNSLSIHSKSGLYVQKGNSGAYRLSGRFGINHYVARVIDREGNTSEIEAAKALGVAARTYLFQNASFQSGCWHIVDSTRTQRVSPNTPSAPALEAAFFTDDLILKGPPVYYHKSEEGENRLSWERAYAQGRKGWGFETILAYSYPSSTIQTLNQRSECVRFYEAEKWLSRSLKEWRPLLNNENGYEPLTQIPTVCELSSGNPYADQERLRIYTRGWRTLNDRTTLAHEYLHLAFRYHPNGLNESYIERLARKLTGAVP